MKAPPRAAFRVAALVLGAACLSVFAWSCREQGVPTEKIVVISPHSQQTQREFDLAFRAWAEADLGRRVEIEWLDSGGTLQCIRYVDDQFEKTPAGIGVDLFFGGGVDPFLHLGQEGLLAPCGLPPDVLKDIPQRHGAMEVYDAKHRWFGACLGGFGIIYNRDVLKKLGLPEPKTWEDLARPDYFGWVASADPRKSGSMYMAYEIIMQAYGWEKGWELAMRLGANCRSFTGGADEVLPLVQLRDAACAPAIDTYGLPLVDAMGPEKMGFVLPAGLTVVNPDAIGMLKGAPHSELATAFIRFVLSEEGQRLWFLKKGAPGGPKEAALYRMPVIPGLSAQYGDEAVAKTDPFKFKIGFKFDIDKKNKRRDALAGLFGACLVDTHDDLSKAWEALKALPADDARRVEFLKAPLSEEEMMRIAEKWQEARFRNETATKWSAAAQQRYRRLAGED